MTDRLQRALYAVLSLAGTLALCALLGFGQPAPAPPNQPGAALGDKNPYDRELAGIDLQLMSPGPKGPEVPLPARLDAPQAAVLLARAYRLRDYLNERAPLTTLLAAVSSDPAQHPLVRDEALHDLALCQLHEHRLSEAQQAFSRLGLIRDWSVVGPFVGGTLAASTGAEGGYVPDSRYPDAGGNRHSWRGLRAPGEQQAGAAGQPAFGPQGFIDLSDLFAHTGAATALAATTIYSDRTRAVALRFSADSAVALWVDGKPLYTSEDGEGFAFDQHAVAVELHPGWNAVVLKLARSLGW